MPRHLTDKDIARFRRALCKVATERFARHGYEGVTMRQLAEALGCSPKTPYRYFKDKADILATVRAQAFNSFADTLAKAAARAPDAVAGGRLVGEAYLAFARRHPHAYRIMFDIDAPLDSCRHPELEAAAARAIRFVTQGAERLAAAGALDADPTLYSWSMWAAIHGVVMLQQSGMLAHGPDSRKLAGFLGATMRRGAAAANGRS